MYRRHSWQARRHFGDTTDQEIADRQTAGLAAIVVVLLLLICSLYLVHQLRRRADMEDCLLSGRPDCAVMVPITH